MMDKQVKLIALTQGAGELIEQNAQEVISYIARVSNPNNQLNFDTAAGLLKYCIKHEHWSIFEHAYMTLEINTTRGIAAQVLRHRSFTYQEFSQRYADTNLLSDKPVMPELRRQDTKNRQNSTDDLDGYLKLVLEAEIQEHFSKAQRLYNRLLNQGVAKECARFVLPLSTPTRIYMTGSCRSWIHYISLRSAHGTQKEHMEIAEGCREIFNEQFEDVAKALEWRD
jgi:thymidylate synthase (FAD)